MIIHKGKNPEWLDLPAMMQIPISSPVVLGRLKNFAKPYDFVLAPIVSKARLELEKQAEKPILITRYTKNSAGCRRSTLCHSAASPNASSCSTQTDRSSSITSMLLGMRYRRRKPLRRRATSNSRRTGQTFSRAKNALLQDDQLRTTAGGPIDLGRRTAGAAVPTWAVGAFGGRGRPPHMGLLLAEPYLFLDTFGLGHVTLVQ